MNSEYREGIAQAKANLEDARERGAEALVPWSEIRDKYFTPEEIAVSKLRARLMGEPARKAHGNTKSLLNLHVNSGTLQ